jgi:cell division protein FtsL
MIGKPTVIWLALAALSSAVVFHTSYRVQAMGDRLADLNRKITHEQETIQVLKAEWSVLNEPARIEKLAREHLSLQPAEAAQLATVAQIPDKQPGIDGVAGMAVPRPGHKPLFTQASVQTSPMVAPRTAPAPVATAPASVATAPASVAPASVATAPATAAPRTAPGAPPVAPANSSVMLAKFTGQVR